MFIPLTPAFQHSSTYGPLPVIWTGSDAPSASNYFAKAAIGSTYIRKVSATETRIYTKIANTMAASDWAVTNSSSGGAGTISIPLGSVREYTAGALGTIATNGGLLSNDTTPVLNTISPTDGIWRIQWVAANVDPIGFNAPLPADCDRLAPILIKFRASVSGANTPVLTCAVSLSEGFTIKNYATAAVTGATYANYTATVLAADIPATAPSISVQVTPGAHAADTLSITAIWLEYGRK